MTLRVDTRDSSAAVISKYEYTLDADGNLTSQIDTQDGTPTTITYGYEVQPVPRY